MFGLRRASARASGAAGPSDAPPDARSGADHATADHNLLAYVNGLLTHAGSVMYVRSTAGGRYLLANAAFGELVGLSADEIVGRTTHDLFPAEIADQHIANDRLVTADGKARASRETATDRAGNVHQYASHKFALTDPQGRIFAVGGISMDVTEFETERRSSQDAQTRFRAVFDHAPIGQIFADMAGAVTAVNEPMAGMLGYRPEEMIGHSIRKFVPEGGFAEIEAACLALLAGDIASTTAVRRFLHRSGHEVPVSVTSALLCDEQDVPRWWVSMARDMTEEERAGAELERAHEATLLAAGRLRALHAIAAAANEATTVGELANTVLHRVCEHFGWPGGALLGWPDLEPQSRPVVLETYGIDSAAVAAFIGPPARCGPSVIDTPFGPCVLVTLAAGRAGQLGWLFRAGLTQLDDEQRELLNLVGIDTSHVVEREMAALLLRDSEERFRSVFDSSPLPMGLTLGDSGTFAAVNGALCELLGRSREELIGTSAAALCHPDDVVLTDPAGAAAAAAPDGRHRFELRLMHANGTVITTMVTLAWMEGEDGQRQLLAQIEDITARRAAEAMLRSQAELDGLTGLANRSHLGRILAELGAAAAHCAILFIDLDSFKLINDTRGHDVGDEVLVAVAGRLRDAVRPSDLVARFGGDEFVVVCQKADARDEPIARRVADRVEAALAVPISTQSGPAQVTASIGIAEGRLEAGAPQRLLQRADTAMYQAKHLGKDRRAFYDDRLHQRTLERQRTEAALRNALDDDRFIVHYQPIVDLRDSAIVGFEALVRLIDEDGALVAPSEFIAVAEQSGLVVPMGAWVLRESLRTIAELRTLTGRPLTISVNIAARQAARADLADTVLRALTEAGLPESALTLELTESALLEAHESTLRQLVILRSRGVIIAIDDFGTGYSSLTYLRRFPVSHLKVDRSFVAGMVSVSSDRAIVRAVTRLADDLGMCWIAEGVETDEQRVALAGLGHGLAQGYLFSRPVPAAMLPTLLGVVPRLRAV